MKPDAVALHGANKGLARVVCGSQGSFTLVQPGYGAAPTSIRWVAMAYWTASCYSCPVRHNVETRERRDANLGLPEWKRPRICAQHRARPICPTSVILQHGITKKCSAKEYRCTLRQFRKSWTCHYSQWLNGTDLTLGKCRPLGMRTTNS